MFPLSHNEVVGVSSITLELSYGRKQVNLDEVSHVHDVFRKCIRVLLLGFWNKRWIRRIDEDILRMLPA